MSHLSQTKQDKTNCREGGQGGKSRPPSHYHQLLVGEELLRILLLFREFLLELLSCKALCFLPLLRPHAFLALRVEALLALVRFRIKPPLPLFPFVSTISALQFYLSFTGFPLEVLITSPIGGQRT